MVFCNLNISIKGIPLDEVTILILVDGFLQSKNQSVFYNKRIVTILILVDGFLQYQEEDVLEIGNTSHNPYFSRWFSAIKKV